MSEPPLIPQRPSHKVDQSSSPAVPTAHPLKSPSPSTVPIAADVPPKIPLNRPSRNLTFEDSPAAAASSPEVPTTRPTHSIPEPTPEPVYDQQHEDMVLPKIPATRPVRASPSPVPASSQPRVPATRPVRPPSVDPRPEQTEAVLEQPKIPTSRPARKTNEQPIEEDASVVESVVSGLKDENNPILVAPTPISAQSNLNNVNSVEENVATASFKSGISPEFSTAAIPLASSVKSDLVKEEANFVKEVVPELVTPSIPSTRPAKVSPPVESFKPEIEKQTPLADELKSATPIVPSRPVKATTPVQDSRPETEVEQKETILEDAKPITPVVPSRPVKATTPVQDSRPETEVEQKETILEDAKQITPVVPSRPANVNPAKPIEHEDIKEGIINASVNLAKTPQVPIQPPVPSKRPSRVVPTEDVGAVESVKKIDDFDNVDSAQVEKNDVSKDSVKNAESETLVPTTKVIESQILSETKPESKESAVSEEKHEDNVEEKVEEKPQAPSTRPSRSPEANLPEAPARPATRPKPTRPPSSDNAKVPPPVPAHKPLPPGGVPPRPKKLTSTATMFERQATSPPAAPTKPKPPAKMNKVGALRASLFKDLDSMISRGGIPPPMGIPKPSAAAGGSEDKSGDNEEIKPKEEEKKLTDVRRGRAKGPKRKLPSAATKSLVADTAAPTATVATVKLESFVGGDVWSVGGRNLEISQEEEEKRLKQEEEERLRKLEEERLRKLEEERLRKLEEERLRKEEEERLKKEEEERLRKVEEERLKKEEEERLKKEEEARLKKEEEARLKKEEEKRQKREEEERLKKEEEERLENEEKEARLKKEEEARLKKEEEARLKKEEEARQKEEEEEARLKADKEKQLEKEKEETQLKKIEEENNKRAEEISEEEKENQDATQLNQIKDLKKGELSDSDLGELKSVDEESTLKPVVVSKDMEVSKTADDELASVANPTATIIDNKAKSLGIPASLESVQPILITTKTPLREESFNSKSETIGASTNSISRSEIVQSAEDSDSEPEILETISIAKPVAFDLEEPAETVTAAKPVTVSVEEPEIVAVQSFETDSVTKPVKDEVFELAPKREATHSGTAQATTVVTSKNDNTVAPESE